jgi:chromosome segregation ATPase
MVKPPEGDIVSSDTERRILAVHGAASAAVVAVSRLSNVLPSHRTDMLEASGEKLSQSLRRLDKSVSQMLERQSTLLESSLEHGKSREEIDRWQKRYHAVERERDSLQEMLIALKGKYESLEESYRKQVQQNQQITAEVRQLKQRMSEADSRLAALYNSLDSTMTG